MILAHGTVYEDSHLPRLLASLEKDCLDTIDRESIDTELVIASMDSDFFQLITDRVSVLRYRGDKTVICTPEYVSERFGVPPCKYADFKSLVGDTADNIRGAAGIGPKTAAALLNRFDTLEDVLENAEKIEKPSVRRAVLENADRLRLNYRLIKLGCGAVLPFDEPEMEYVCDGRTTNEILRAINIL